MASEGLRAAAQQAGTRPATVVVSKVNAAATTKSVAS